LDHQSTTAERHEKIDQAATGAGEGRRPVPPVKGQDGGRRNSANRVGTTITSQSNDHEKADEEAASAGKGRRNQSQLRNDEEVAENP
jgi:hypothetical protein